MLDNQIIKKVNDFVYSKPRSINEVAQHIGKNWRTADRYLDFISKEFGTISVRTFREGTRGALKIAYWSSIEKLSNSMFQEKLLKDIETFKRKEDFSAFDIFQHVDDKNKKVTIEKQKSEDKIDLSEFQNYLEKTEKQILIFSGNLSWINSKSNKIDLFNTVEKLVKNKTPIKIISRVDMASLENIEKILSLNFKYGKELIEIRHHEQPLRAFIIDNKIVRIKEIKEPTGKINELNKRVFIYYTIKDKEWVEWLSRIFWKIFNNSIDSKKRIEELRKLK